MMIRGVTIKMHRAVLRLKPFKRLEGRPRGAISRLNMTALEASAAAELLIARPREPGLGRSGQWANTLAAAPRPAWRPLLAAPGPVV